MPLYRYFQDSLYLLLGFLYYERFTGYFYFGRLEKKITLLRDLQIIASQGIIKNQELYPIYQTAVSELAQYKVLDIKFPLLQPVSFSSSETWGKAISGASVWIFILVIGVSSDLKKTHRLSVTIIGVSILILIFGALFAFVGVQIPTIINPWVNYIGFPIIQVLILYFLVRKISPT